MLTGSRPQNSFERKMSRSESDRLVSERFALLGYSDSDYSSDGGGGNSDLTASILNSVTQLGSAAILANSNNPGIVTPVYSRPVNYAVPPGTASNGRTLILFGLFVLVGVFAYQKL